MGRAQGRAVARPGSARSRREAGRGEQAKREELALSAREQAHSEPRRPENRPGGARRHFRRSGEQCAVAEGAKREELAPSARAAVCYPVIARAAGPRQSVLSIWRRGDDGTFLAPTRKVPKRMGIRGRSPLWIPPPAAMQTPICRRVETLSCRIVDRPAFGGLTWQTKYPVFLARGAWPGDVGKAWHGGAVRTPPPTDRDNGLAL